MRIVLYQPQIPQNTGNVVRTCAVTGTDLTLVHPLGFSTSSRMLRRAGLDYWEGVAVDEVHDLLELLEQRDEPFYFFSSHAKRSYTEVAYGCDDWLIFGSETEGLPNSFLERWPERFLSVPMLPEARCLNLATTVGIVSYEAWRQQGFTHP